MTLAMLGKLGLLLSAVCLLNACEFVAGYRDFTRRHDAGSCELKLPERLEGPKLRRVSNGAHCFWMDETEVTWAQYRDFLQRASGFPQDDPCQNNETFEPASANADSGEVCYVQPTIEVNDGANHPVVCIDWCDAKAYCAWAGKALCKDSSTSTSVASRSDWYAACANGDQNTVYPYGSEYKPNVCNGVDSHASECDAGFCTRGVGAMPECKNDVDVYDLAGNVREWTDACLGTSGKTDECPARGGSFLSDRNDLQCGTSRTRERGTHDATIGFRCCAYP